ncbi:hypothetical protein [Halarcobacter sp.]|uniref:hypothetical protein n=1 Tax=Halarcobacter sp. TaxID=2321133 RepID=UPI0029F5C6AF|nr:hypothetical protein [Halarcobacter sp.]
MKFDKQLAVIIVLVSLLLTAIAISFYFYKEKEKVAQDNNRLVNVYVAKNTISKDTLINESHLKKTVIARQFVLTKPLLKQEILGKYAKETIYQNEAFLKEKLSNKIEIVEEKSLDFKYNSYNMSMKLFENPNFSLEPNDIIKIISVYQKGKDVNNYAVQYVAKNIKILGFLSEGVESEKALYKKKIKKLVKKQQVEEIINVKADEIILDIKEKVLLKLIDDYNKGKQLWMVKSKIEEDDEEKKEEKPKKIVQKKKLVKPVSYRKPTYPIKWYTPKDKTLTKTATISYANNNDKKTVKKAKITEGYKDECSKTDKLLIGLSHNIYLRTKPSFRAKINNKIHKNYIMSYVSKSKIQPDWYILCDGTYVNKKDVRDISFSEYKKLEK